MTKGPRLYGGQVGSYESVWPILPRGVDQGVQLFHDPMQKKRF